MLFTTCLIFVKRTAETGDGFSREVTKKLNNLLLTRIEPYYIIKNMKERQFDLDIKERWLDLQKYADDEKISRDDTRLDDETRDRICLMAFIVPEFGEAYKMDKQEGYFYLKKYGGIDYIDKNWKTLFTEMENPRDVIHKIFDLCKENGGYL